MSKKSKRLQVKEGSRLKLKEGTFARVERTPKPRETTVEVKVYDKLDDLYHEDYSKTIPMGHIAEVVRF